jgi:hypothetical protein
MSIVSRATAASVLRRKQREAAVAAPLASDQAAPASSSVALAAPADAASPPAVPTASDAVAAVRSALHSAAGVHAATMELIEGSAEWADYDAHVTFELQALRHRYAAAANWGAMPTAVRSQMSAHLRQKQAAVMAGHAAELAGEVLAVMSRSEREALARKLLRLERAAGEDETRVAALPQPQAPTGSLPATGDSGIAAPVAAGAKTDKR